MPTICAAVTEEQKALLIAYAAHMGWEQKDILWRRNLTEALAEAEALERMGVLTVEIP